MNNNFISTRLTRELDLLKTETVAEQGEGKLLTRIIKRINLELGRLRNIAATRTFSTEGRVCKLVDKNLKELKKLHEQRTDAAYYQGTLGGKSYVLDLKGDKEIRKKIQQTLPKIEKQLFLLQARSSLGGCRKQNRRSA